MQSSQGDTVRHPIRLIGILLLSGLVMACEQDDGDSQAMSSSFTEGSELYQRQCAACHQPDGSGRAGVFPPLAGHAADLATAPGGRDYLIRVLLHGVGGAIEVDGQSYSGVMPGFRRLSDDQIAAILNHITHAKPSSLPDDFEPFAPADIPPHREERLPPGNVRESRPDTIE